jgi:hypothetical protein
MRYLLETLTDIRQKHGNVADALENIAKMPLPLARLELCRVRNLGPKVVDCFLLNALGDLSAPPVDVHVARMAGELGLIPKGMQLPSPGYCRKHICSENDALDLNVPWCPKAMRTQLCLKSSTSTRGTCIRAALNQRFENSGWIQALLFSQGLNSSRRANEFVDITFLSSILSQSLPVSQILSQLLSRNSRRSSASLFTKRERLKLDRDSWTD